MRRFAVAASLLLPALAACYNDVFNVTAPPAPANLTYQVEPSGDPSTPSGILLRWDAVNSANLESYRVYSRPSTTSGFGARGTTTSTTFHDNGYPNLEYYVTAVSVDGGESQPSNAITVDERLALPRPTTLTSISLNGAIHLEWTDNAYTSDPSAFSVYRVYSTGYDIDSSLCGTTWSLEGTTVSSSFLSGNLPNGVPRCFAVSAVSIEGYESLWSPLRYDTPRPDGRNLLLTALDADPTKAAFRFWLDANADHLVSAGELAQVLNGTSAAADFQVVRNANGVFLQPVRAGTSVLTYGTVAVDDLTSIDIAPATGYGSGAVRAVPGFGYVFQMNGGDLFYRYGALRVTAVGPDYIIVDWAYQTDPGNPELVRAVR
jgi:fibronectin type 3 domain-containing protein